MSCQCDCHWQWACVIDVSTVGDVRVGDVRECFRVCVAVEGVRACSLCGVEGERVRECF